MSVPVIVDGQLNPKIPSNPNVHPEQAKAILRAGKAASDALVEGMDTRQRPVVRATFATGPSRYALFRNGKPTGVADPVEEWV